MTNMIQRLLASRASDRLLLRVEAHRVTVSNSEGDGDRIVGEATYPGRSGLAKTVRELVEEAASNARSTVRIELYPPLVQMRTLHDLPPVKDSDLPDLVGQQQDMIFRPVGGDAVLGAVWDSSMDSGSAQARAALVDRALLDELEAAVESSGGTVDAFVAAEEPSDGDRAGIPFRTTKIRRRMRARRRRRWIGVGTVSILGWIVAGVVYAADLISDDRVIRAELARMEDAVARMDSIDRQISAFTPLAAAFIRQGPESAWIDSRLRGVTEHLPDEAHLHGLHMRRDGSGALHVHAPDPVAVIDALSRWWKGPLRLPAGSDGRPVQTDTESDVDDRSGIFTLELEPPS